MVEATEIEKKSLEAHVELCAERYNALETRLDSLDEKISAVSTMIKEVKETITHMAEKQNDRLIQWGVGIIGTLIAATTYLIFHYVFT